MSRNLKDSLSKLSKPPRKEIHGIVGAIISGRPTIEVSGRDGFIYVRLRDNTSEFIQAYNDKIQNVYYGVPVVIIRDGNRYSVLGKNSKRYSQWITQDKSDGIGTNTNQLMMLRHGTSHSFDPSSNNGGGDISWIYSRQFMPGLISPYNTNSPNVYIAPLAVKNNIGEWKYVGNTGTVSIINYKPTTGTRMVLVSVNTVTGNPYLTVSSGTTIPEGLTGTSSYLQYMPVVPSSDYMPLSLIRLESGTTGIGWDNITDVREFGGGGSDLAINNTGSYSNINFPDFSVTTSGSNAFVRYSPNTASGGDDSVLFSVQGRLATGTNSSNLYMVTKPTTINRFYLYGKTLGTTGTVTVDVNLIRSGTSSTVFSTQANRPTLQFTDADGWVYGIPNITSFGEGDVLSMDIDTVALGSEDIVVSKLITGTSSSSGGIIIEENDGSPSISGVTKIKFDGSTVTDNGGNIVTVKSLTDYIYVRDEKAANTDGGTFTLGTWRTRTINTEISDVGNHATINSGTSITLDAGIYECRISAPAYAVGSHKILLYNSTDGSDIIYGSSAYAQSSNLGMSYSTLSGRFTLSSPKSLEVRHRCNVTKSTDGMGVAANFGVVEVYTQAEFWKVG